eukprot:scaffold1843_cov143-Skeletonema_menzelii.AAC.18
MAVACTESNTVSNIIRESFIIHKIVEVVSDGTLGETEHGPGKHITSAARDGRAPFCFFRKYLSSYLPILLIAESQVEHLFALFRTTCLWTLTSTPLSLVPKYGEEYAAPCGRQSVVLGEVGQGSGEGHLGTGI